MAEYNPLPLLQISEQLAKLPGIGMKTAQRLAYHILNMPAEEVELFTSSISEARNSVRVCKVCQNFTEQETCQVCDDQRRAQGRCGV